MIQKERDPLGWRVMGWAFEHVVPWLCLALIIAALAMLAVTAPAAFRSGIAG